LRDYLYVPLGGNRRGAWRTYFNLMLTMLLGGLWHGAAWNFVLWGGYQALLLSCHRAATRSEEPSAEARSKLQPMAPAGENAVRLRFPLVPLADSYLRIFVFFLFTCYGWLLFRASSLEQIKTFTSTLLGFGGGHPSVISKPNTSALLGVVVLIFLQVCDFNKGRLESFKYWRPAPQGFLYAILIFVLIMGASNAPVQFIYFQF
jgi:D-alanyl-lipoteichoic acid acyltransferase DltB (MBOAT superfamily)